MESKTVQVSMKETLVESKEKSHLCGQFEAGRASNLRWVIYPITPHPIHFILQV